MISSDLFGSGDPGPSSQSLRGAASMLDVIGAHVSYQTSNSKLESTLNNASSLMPSISSAKIRRFAAAI